MGSEMCIRDRWNPASPSKMRYVEGESAGRRSLRLFEIDVLTGESAMIADFTDRIQVPMRASHALLTRSSSFLCMFTMFW